MIFDNTWTFFLCVCVLSVCVLETAIACYMEHFRSRISNANVTLKMHILERHVVEQIEITGCGLGVLSEHGLEGLHQYWNKIEDTYQHMKTQQLRMYRCCMKTHLTAAMPEVVSKMHNKRRAVYAQNEC